MAEVVYVKEYEPSCACLRIGQDPIYKQSKQTEAIRVAMPAVPIVALIFVGIVTGIGLTVYALSRHS